MFDLVDFLLDCEQDYEDTYSLKAVNSSLKIIGYEGEFKYDPVNNAIRYDGGIEQSESQK